MLTVIARNELRSFREELKAALSQGNPEVHVRTLTTPGGPIKDAQLLWHPQPGVWSYISPKSYEGRRWLCWYGVDLGVSRMPLQPAVEINLSTSPSDRRLNGRALVDPLSRRLFLGHKGSLGGGRGGQLKLKEFEANIQGFGKDTIQLDADREENVFVVGGLQDTDFLDRLRAYVGECARLRAAARGNRIGPITTSTTTPSSDKFTPEHDQDGFLVRPPVETRRIRRLHGRVVNALREEIGVRAVNSSHLTMRPDLYIKRRDGSIGTLFEVKASSDTQSWFTAIGQLFVYAAGQTEAPIRVLVCPAPLKNPSFSTALAELDVRLITFREHPKGRFTFYGLESLVAG